MTLFASNDIESRDADVHRVSSIEVKIEKIIEKKLENKSITMGIIDIFSPANDIDLQCCSAKRINFVAMLGLCGALSFASNSFFLGKSITDSNIIGIPIGLISAFPALCFGIMGTKSLVRSISLAIWGQYYSMSLARLLFEVLFFIPISIIGGSPQGYLTWRYGYPMLGMYVIPFVMCTTLTKAASIHLIVPLIHRCVLLRILRFLNIQKYMLLFSEDDQLSFIKEKLTSIGKALNIIPQSQLESLIDCLQDKDSSIKDRLNSVCTLSELDSSISKRNGALAAKLIGAFLGGISAGVIYPLTKEGAAQFLNHDVILSCIALITTYLMGSIMAHAGLVCFEQMYNFYYARHTNNPLMSQTFFSTILSLCSLVPMITLIKEYFGLENIYSWLFMFFSIVGPFFINLWSLQDFFDALCNRNAPYKRIQNLIRELVLSLNASESSYIDWLYNTLQPSIELETQE